MTRHMKKWTDAEDEILKEMVGAQSFKRIGNCIGRTEKSVESRLERINYIKPSSAQGYLTAHQLANIINADGHTVLLWINKYGLPHSKKVVRRSRENIYIDPVLFWKWAFENKRRVNFSKIPRNILVPEPAWVQEERIKDLNTIARRTQQLWTKEEDERLLDLRSKGYTQVETGKMMGRSRRGIQVREKKLQNTREMITTH